MTIDIVAQKIAYLKEAICSMFDEVSLSRTEEELCEDGNNEEIINNHLDDIQELYISSIEFFENEIKQLKEVIIDLSETMDKEIFGDCIKEDDSQ